MDVIDIDIEIDIAGRTSATGRASTILSPTVLSWKGPVRSAAVEDREPAANRAEACVGRFCAWRGASGRRYIASVYQVARRAVDGGVPDYERFVLISVVRGETGRRILGVTAVERVSERRAALLMGMARGADEWHVHLLAEDREARAAMVADLAARHCAGEVEARRA